MILGNSKETLLIHKPLLCVSSLNFIMLSKCLGEYFVLLSSRGLTSVNPSHNLCNELASVQSSTICIEYIDEAKPEP